MTYEEVTQLTKGKGAKATAAATAGEGGRKVRVKKEKDPNMPRKPKPTFLLFAEEKRPLLLEKGLKFSEVGQVLGKEWKRLSEAEKKVKEEESM